MAQWRRDAGNEAHHRRCRTLQEKANLKNFEDNGTKDDDPRALTSLRLVQLS